MPDGSSIHADQTSSVLEIHIPKLWYHFLYKYYRDNTKKTFLYFGMLISIKFWIYKAFNRFKNRRHFWINSGSLYQKHFDKLAQDILEDFFSICLSKFYAFFFTCSKEFVLDWGLGLVVVDTDCWGLFT